MGRGGVSSGRSKVRTRLLCVCLISWLVVSCGAQVQTLSQDARALLAFKAAVDNPTVLNSWTGSNPCGSQWLGVTCGAVPGNSTARTVTALSLSQRQLSGQLPSDLGSLASLQLLNLAGNQLNGHIPEEIGKLGLLMTLILNTNGLTGTIPPNLAACKNLQLLDLSNNNLQGTVPAAFSFLTGCTIKVDGNALCSTVPGANCAGLLANSTRAASSSGTSTGLSGQLLVVTVLVVVAAVGVVLGLIWLLVVRLRKRTAVAEEWLPYDQKDVQKKRAKEIAKPVPRENAKSLSLQEMLKATGSFGRGVLLEADAYGKSYKATMEDGRLLSVKRLSSSLSQLELRDFKKSAEALGRISHPNLVALLGFCGDGMEKLLAYEWVPCGSLYDHLHGTNQDPPLDWAARSKIAVGIAKALSHLQDGATKPPIYHADLKSSNVLLDVDFSAKISDFGLAQLVPEGAGHHATTRVLGQFGYQAPEYVLTGACDSRSVVYTFGVLLLEIVTGRKPVDMKAPHGQQSLVTWVGPHLNSIEKLEKMADPRLQGMYPKKDLVKLAAVAAMCLQPEPDFRPIMVDVVVTLESLQLYETVPRPASSARAALVASWRSSPKDLVIHIPQNEAPETPFCTFGVA